MSLPRRVLVLQHAPWETPGLIAAALDSRGLGWDVATVLDDPDPALPDVADLAGLVVMGGPMGALDDAAHPGLPAERRLLAAATAAGVPVLGVCLGMQLLAVALGARLLPGHGQEIGFSPVALTGAGLRDEALYPLTVDASPDPVVLHWHDDAVEAPPGATVLARTDLTPVQAFRHGSALGLQFHLEVDTALLGRWLAEPVMSGGLGATRAGQVAEDGAARLMSLVPRAVVVFGAVADTMLARRG